MTHLDPLFLDQILRILLGQEFRHLQGRIERIIQLARRNQGVITNFLTLIARPHAAAAGLIGLVIKLKLTGQDIFTNNGLTFVTSRQKRGHVDIAIIAHKAHRQVEVIERHRAQLRQQCRRAAQMENGQDQADGDQPTTRMSRDRRESCLPVCHEI